MATINKDGMVVLTQDEYNSLIDDSNKLTALENWGVDNWSEYSEAMREFYNNDDDENSED